MTPPELLAIEQVELDWTKHLDGIWRDDPSDIPEVQAAARRTLFGQVDALFRSESAGSPLGAIVVGQAGAGKTHLLGALRAEVFRRQGTFVLVDLATVRDFWETVLAGWFASLTHAGFDGRPQHRRWLDELLVRFGGRAMAGIDTDTLHVVPAEVLAQRAQQLLQLIAREHPEEMLRHQDVLRALFLVASRDFELQTVGYTRLQGRALSDAVAERVGMRAAAPAPADLVAGLSWLGSLVSPVVLAFDQLDAVVAEHHRAAEEPADSESKSRLLAIGSGLLALRDRTRRTLVVLSLVEASWEVLQRHNIAAMAGRFRDPIALPAVRSGELARRIVEARLTVSYHRSRFTPPYASWPFRPEAFAGAEHRYVRELLRACDEHLRACASAGVARELTSFAEPEAPPPPAPVPEARQGGVRLGGTEVPWDALARHVSVAGGSRSGASALAASIVEQARARGLSAVLVDTTGRPGEPAGEIAPDRWFGGGTTVISGADAAWVDRFARDLATWGGPGPLRGLVVLDDAREHTRLEGVRRLLARPSRVAVVLVTQDPRSLDAELLARVGTQLWGKVSAPGAVEVVRERLRQHGVDGHDVPRLESGTFYLCAAGLAGVVKVRAE